MNVNVQPFSIKYQANDGVQYVARSVPVKYNIQNGQAIPTDTVNVSRIDEQGKVIGFSEMSHEQFLSYLLQSGISTPCQQYEMPKTN